MSRFGVKVLAIAAFAMGLALSSRASADSAQVLLVRPRGAAREVSTALVRVEGELVADGFEVVSVEVAPGTTSEMAMNQAENQSSTTVGLFLSADGSRAELWVVDRLTNKTVVRRVATVGQSENLLPEVLAVKAVELLRASLLELVVERNAATTHASPRATQHASDWAARPLASPQPSWAIETGAAVLWSPTQIDAAFESVLRARFVLTDRLQMRLSFLGLGTRPQVTGTGGSALLDQWSGLAEGLFIPFPNFALRPLISFGVGTLHTNVEGQASFPYQGLSTSQWAFAADAGLGLGARLASRLELSVEAHALWAVPEPVVHFVSDDGPHSANPGVVGSLTLLGWL